MSEARRRASARARLNQALTEHLISDFAEHGAEVIARMRKEKPIDYIKMVNAVLHKDEAAEAALSTSIKVIERRVIRPNDPTQYAPWRNNPDFVWPKNGSNDVAEAGDADS